METTQVTVHREAVRLMRARGRWRAVLTRAERLFAKLARANSEPRFAKKQPRSRGASFGFAVNLWFGRRRLTFAAKLRGLHSAEYQNERVAMMSARNGPRQLERRS